MYNDDDYKELLEEMNINEVIKKVENLNFEHRFWILNSINQWYEKDKKYDYSNVLSFKTRRNRILKRKGLI